MVGAIVTGAAGGGSYIAGRVGPGQCGGVEAVVGGKCAPPVEASSLPAVNRFLFKTAV